MTDRPQGVGCAAAVVVVNAALMGLLASAFVTGPYSSRGQEIWYRYGSIGFLLFGAILPGAALALWARRSHALVVALVLWMFLALLAWFAYAINSGGGI